jgi:methionyl-tRNA synthetase
MEIASNKNSIPYFAARFELISESKNNFMTESKDTITAALPYTNGPIHIGHLAGVYVPRYLFRYLRLQGRDVLFVCGSDEHGVAISMKAKRRHNASGN